METDEEKEEEKFESGEPLPNWVDQEYEVDIIFMKFNLNFHTCRVVWLYLVTLKNLNLEKE